MHLQLEVLDGSMRGEQFAFDLVEGQEVRVGRDGSVCEVTLAADYVRVSRQHCALSSVLGRIRIRTNKQNPVLVSGEALFDDSVLEDGTVVRLGHGGPRLRVAVRYPKRGDVAASTIMVKRGELPPEVEVRQQAARVQQELQLERKRAWKSRVVIAAVAMLGVFYAVQARAEAALLRQAALDPQQLDVVAKMIEDRASEGPAMAETVARVAESVYCVMERRGDVVRPVGTAWVVDRDRGLLATNAHVADNFVEGATIVRAAGARSADLNVTAARSHPAYEVFGEQLGRYREALDMSGESSSNRSMRGFDVALLVIAEAEREQLAPDLELLAADQVHELESGRACATVGFPAEGIGFNPRQPQHKTHLGHVVALTDYFMAAGEAEHAQLVHTSLPVAGGASGSPLIDRRGRVIGLISSANVVHSKEGRRIPLAGTTCAQRVDTLHELLAGKVEDERRMARWSEVFGAAVGNAKKSMEQLLIEQFEKALQRRGGSQRAKVLSREQIELSYDARSSGTIKTVEIEAPATATYLCCAIADDVMDIDVTVFLPDGTVREDVSPDWYPSVLFELEKGQKVRIATFRQGAKPTGATVLLLQQVE